MSERLYVYVKDWERFQPRSDRPNMPWLRLHTDLLGNDAWLELTPADTKLLITVWMLCQRYGNGRVKADQAWLMEQSKVAYGSRSRNLERLVQAGFITLSTTKAAPNGGLEKNRVDKRREERAQARDQHSENGKPKTLTAAELYRMADEAESEETPA